MNIMTRATVLILLAAVPFCCDADDCFANEVEAHVLEQFGIYGPFSADREYFGFIYRHEGVIASAVSRGGVCRWTQTCEVKTDAAAARIPGGAKILGEWHTHPHASGSQSLSDADVRAANSNRHIRCYRAFFSTSRGEIAAWDTASTMVKTAMASLVRLGNYRHVEVTSKVADYVAKVVLERPL